MTAKIIALLEQCQYELGDRYDGAPDSPTLWMGDLLEQINLALNDLKGAI